jgi:hypothetical protein
MCNLKFLARKAYVESFCSKRTAKYFTFGIWGLIPRKGAWFQLVSYTFALSLWTHIFS